MSLPRGQRRDGNSVSASTASFLSTRWKPGRLGLGVVAHSPQPSSLAGGAKTTSLESAGLQSEAVSKGKRETS